MINPQRNSIKIRFTDALKILSFQLIINFQGIDLMT